MPYVNGKWEYEDSDVGSRVSSFLATDNPLIKQARAQGVAAANRRGLANSSIAAGAAQAEAYKVAVPIAMQEAGQRHQSNMGEQDRVAQSQRQTADLAGSMARLREQAGFTAQIATQSEAGQMERLREGGRISATQQERDIAARMEQQRLSGDQNLAGIRTQGEVQGTLNAQQAAQEMARLERQLVGADAQQTRDINAQMARLTAQAGFTRDQAAQQFGYQRELNTQQNTAELGRLELQGRISSALQAQGAEQQRAFAAVQGDIQARLQAQGNTEQIQRMGIEFGNQMQAQSAEQANAIARINASGDQEMRRLTTQVTASANELAANLAAGRQREVAGAIVNILQTESQMRAALLANTTMPAAERMAYEAAITQLGNPARAAINAIYASSAAPAAAPAAMIAPPSGLAAGVAPPAPGGLNAGGAVPPPVAPAAQPAWNPAWDVPTNVPGYVDAYGVPAAPQVATPVAVSVAPPVVAVPAPTGYRQAQWGEERPQRFYDNGALM